MTERETILAMRNAYILGARAHCDLSCSVANVTRKAAELYPLPKVTRPRIVSDRCNPGDPTKGRQFRVVGGLLQTRDWFETGDDSAWQAVSNTAGQDEYCIRLSPRRVELLAELFANPTETVEDDGK